MFLVLLLLYKMVPISVVIHIADNRNSIFQNPKTTTHFLTTMDYIENCNVYERKRCTSFIVDGVILPKVCELPKNQNIKKNIDMDQLTTVFIRTNAQVVVFS